MTYGLAQNTIADIVLATDLLAAVVEVARKASIVRMACGMA